jgi:hypothetical protein
MAVVICSRFTRFQCIRLFAGTQPLFVTGESPALSIYDRLHVGRMCEILRIILRSERRERAQIHYNNPLGY